MENLESQSTQQDNNAYIVIDDNNPVLHDIKVEEITREEACEGSKNAQVKKRKTASTLRSPAWAAFTQVFVDCGDPPEPTRHGKCKRCGALIKSDSKNGTSSLMAHTRICELKHSKASQDKTTQTMLNLRPGTAGTEAGTLTTWIFDQHKCRRMLAEMITLDELPFRFVEREGFKKFVESLCPNFKIPSRQTVRQDCMKLFLERKIILKSFFQKKGMGRVSITTDCWTAINNTSFICVTAHCIENWILQKKIISFRKICSHKGDDIGAAVLSTLEEWGLERVLSCTMDNASANDSAITYMKLILGRNASIINEKYLHVRCVAHIINLVVSDGLEEIGMSVRRVREAVKWIKASPFRSEQFKEAVQLLKITSTKSLCLDVPTRWNSTYLMLVSAQPFEQAFKWFATMEKGFKHDLTQKRYKDEPIGPPNEQDWVNIRRMIDHLERFYDLTLLFSGTKYATSHLFFKEMCDLFEIISELEFDEDVEINRMAERMRKKLEKYWLEANDLNPKMNKILYIAALLDPRQKMKHVELCLKTVYGERRGMELGGLVKENLDELFAFYKAHHMTPPPTALNTSNSSSPDAEIRQEARVGNQRKGLCSLISQVEPNAAATSEVALYLLENQYMMTDEEVKNDNFDILKWWKLNGPRFPIMAEMAKDILAIPISSVASECAFSTGGRVLSPFRSSLTPNMVEALICAEDWLKSSSANVLYKDEEDVPEEELENDFQTVLLELGVGGGGSRTSESVQTINIV